MFPIRFFFSSLVYARGWRRKKARETRTRATNDSAAAAAACRLNVRRTRSARVRVNYFIGLGPIPANGHEKILFASFGAVNHDFFFFVFLFVFVSCCRFHCNSAVRTRQKKIINTNCPISIRFFFVLFLFPRIVSYDFYVGSIRKNKTRYVTL